MATRLLLLLQQVMFKAANLYPALYSESHVNNTLAERLVVYGFILVLLLHQLHGLAGKAPLTL